MDLDIRMVSSESDEKWDDFVTAHQNGSIYHHSAWRRVLESTYGYHPLYLALEHPSSKEMRGVYPLMLVKSRFTGDRIVSLPFTSYCPPLIPDAAFAEVVHYNLAHNPDVGYLELKSGSAVHGVPEFLVQQCSHVTHVLDLSPGKEKIFQSFHPTSVRQRIRKAEKIGFKLRLAKSADDLGGFYRLHIKIRKKHGLPPHPFKFFKNMWNELAPKNLLFAPMLEYDGTIVAGALTLRFKDTFIYEYSAADEQYLHLSANQMLIWEVIKIGCSEGANYFDFGRSSLDNPTLIEFKERWGAKRLSLSYYYYPKMKKVGIEGSLGRRILSRANRMLPKALLQMEGQLVYRHLG